MGRRLQGIGALLIVMTIALWVAETAGWIGGPTDDRWSGLTLKAGLIALAASLVFRVFAPVVTLLGKGRCTVCGRATERGRAYCLDHLQETVNATRDRASNPTLPLPRRLRSSRR